MDTILIIILALSICLNIFFGFAIYKSLSRIDLLETWIIDFKNSIIILYNNLKSIDNRGIFEKDDDVGILFDELSTLINDVVSKVIDEDNNTDN